MSSADNIILDLDGTVYIDNQIINNSDSEIRRLARKGKSIYYLTNNDSKNTKHYVDKLNKLNLPVEENSIISPIHVMINWVKEHNIKSFYILGVQELIDELEKETGAVNSADNPELIIVAFDKELTYQKLEIVCELINKGVPYYLSHIDIFCPTLKGNMPDCGAIGYLIEKTTGIKSINNFGKPSDLMTNYINQILDKAQKKTVVGDRIHTDIELGKKLGADTILVCSGEYQNPDSKNNKINNTEIYNTLTDYLTTI
jgi:HAD superfamily hydrolase (TIGR01450 family)